MLYVSTRNMFVEGMYDNNNGKEKEKTGKYKLYVSR
jgi:hypothetical protein